MNPRLVEFLLCVVTAVGMVIAVLVQKVVGSAVVLLSGALMIYVRRCA